jgi:hypothetical protein
LIAWVATALLGTGGLLLIVRGTIYQRAPHSPLTEKRRRKNLQRGQTTDMAVFGRKVRRFGVVLLLLAAIVSGWRLSAVADARHGERQPPQPKAQQPTRFPTPGS